MFLETIYKALQKHDGELGMNVKHTAIAILLLRVEGLKESKEALKQELQIEKAKTHEMAARMKALGLDI